MESSNDILTMLMSWGSSFGPIFNIIGAFLLILGFREQWAEAKKIDAFITSQLNKVTWDNKLDNAISVRELRAKERRKAKLMCIMGLSLFIFGFLLQAIASIPAG